jgi:hypothetical protein
MLEESDRIDMALKLPDGRVRLVITDAGVTTDAEQRANLLALKLGIYAKYVGDGEFRTNFPDKSPADCEIVVMSRLPATEQMQQMSNVALVNRPEAKIPVRFETFDPDAGALSTAAAAKPSSAPQEPSPAVKLMKAGITNDLELMKTAVAEGADLNEVNPLGLTSLDTAVYHGNTEMVRWLFAHGAKLPARSHNGRSLWIPARAKGLRDIEMLLIENGAKPTLFDRVMAILYRFKHRNKQTSNKA